MISNQNPAILAFLMTCVTAMTLTTHSSQAQNLTPELDQFAYTMTGDVNIFLDSQIITFTSNMTNCQQANGNPPIDTGPTALVTNAQFIGITAFRYNLKNRKVQFNSETRDLICDNGVFVEVLFTDDFENEE